MIDDVRNLMGDLLTGKIKDERLLLLADELRAAERKLADTKAENEVLRNENQTLKTEIKELASTVADLKDDLKKRAEEAQSLEKTAHEIIRLIFETGQPLTIPHIANSIHLTVSEAKFHIDDLDGRDLICQAGIEPQPYFIGERPRTLPTFDLTPRGRKYYMENRNTK